MPCIPLQGDIIYGPVLSRRLGRSLGINLMPIDYKLCSFDCIYCQYGCTDILTKEPPLSELPYLDDVCRAVAKALRKPRSIDFLTFSGNGESTLHPHFLEIVQAIKALRDELRPDVKLALLSNASIIHNAEIQTALEIIDAPMLKLDAGEEQTFNEINRPVSGIQFAEIVKGLKTNSPLMLQTMFIDGVISNICGEAFQAWINLVGELQPSLIQIYSTERPTAEAEVKGVDPKKLQQIAEEIKQIGISVEVFFRKQ